MTEQPRERSGIPGSTDEDGETGASGESAGERSAPPGAQRDAGGAGEPKEVPVAAGTTSPAPHGAPGAYRPPPPDWVVAVQPGEPPAPMSATTGWAALATGLLAALLLGAGLGINLLLIALPAAVAAGAAARAAGRRPRPWTLCWAACCLALLVVPALRDAGWPSFLAVAGALATGSLALQGGRGWRAAVLGPTGLLAGVLPGAAWAIRSARERAAASRRRWGPIVRTVLIAVALLVVFGALFAGADAAFADLLGSMVPETSVADGPVRVLCFVLGLAVALAAARTAAAPWRWDRLRTPPGKARGRLEWALPLVVLDMLFAAFNAVQLTVLFGGYDAVLRKTGLTYAEYARQGFWQLLWATLLTLVVIALALRWAPRGRQRDRALVRAVLGTLCLLTLLVVLSALRRMDLYVDAYGLTRLRLSVAAVEIWLGLVIVLIMVAGALGLADRRGAPWLPRAVTVSAAAGVLVFGLLSPDGVVARQNVDRYERTGKIDLEYLRQLSADAVPALDALPEPQRSCALHAVARELAAEDDEPWYATGYGETRARKVLEDRPLRPGQAACTGAGRHRDHRTAVR
ncbi:DUF4173 domain-containing protein [Streptomyces sp. JJ36]|uniref:DUF4153 domain-containing protein n=1 Tax=Streptomyces sp. JJ36 TaxID=2736645 RepID=UPI001F3B8BBE|nr:DUF4173 domain-containing protein [Streptomyces sp. JJ36]MCF6523940.1 DUF4173 domain-containing protein [Streptomyces sp. JJ36]